MQFKYKLHIFLFSILVLLTSTPHQVHSDINVTIDGVVGVDEYQYSGTFENFMTVFWSATDSEIYFALQANTTGYVAIGIEPGLIMTDVDLIYGSVNGSDISVADAYSSSLMTGSIQNDTALGGTFDVLEYSVSEVGGVTTFEFRRLLDTGDSKDNAISFGEIDIIWSSHSSDDFAKKPSHQGSAELDIVSGESKETHPMYWVFGGIAAIVVVGGLSIYFIIKKFKK
jgi:hypothetical protein